MSKITNKIKKQVTRTKHLAKFSVRPIKHAYKNKSFRDSFSYSHFYETMKIDDRTVLFECSHGSKIGGNPFAIFLHMLNDKCFKNYTFIWVLNETNPMSSKYEHLPNVRFVKRDSISYMKYLCKAKYLINDTTFPFYFQKKKGQIYVNTWHGTPIKTLGKDVQGTLGQHKNAIRNFLHADYILNPNDFTAQTIVRSHDLQEIYPGKVLDDGYPRVDLTIHADKERIKKELEETLGFQIDKKIVLYAPTWRGEIGQINNIEKEIAGHINSIQEQLPKDYVLLLKVHNLTYKYIQTNQEIKRLCIPNWMETNELLSITDVLISDYSSIFFEILPLGKPVLFFVYDREKYENERGMYLNLDDMPGPLCRTTDEIIQALSNIAEVQRAYQSSYQKCIDTYCYNDDGQSTKRFLDTVFHGKREPKTVDIPQKNKKRLLFFGGGFTTNGVTNSMLNLLENIDYDRYDVTILHGGNLKGDIQENLKKINPNTRILFRCGTFNFTVSEYYRHQLIMNSGLKRKIFEKMIPHSLYKKEMKRIVGDTHFDIAIDFSGYSPFWTLLLSSTDIGRKIIYLHSDMVADSNRKVNEKFPLKKNLETNFKLYHQFDKLVCVSKDVTEINKRKLESYDISHKIVNVDNALNFQRILSHNEDTDNIQKWSGQEYWIKEEINDGTTFQAKGIIMPSNEHINFVTLGRLSPEKDHEKLIEAFSKVHNTKPDTRLYIIGSGNLESKLRSKIDSFSLNGKVILTGAMDKPFSLINQCDCFVLSSNYEGQGLAIIEALVLKKPVISTNIPGPKGILEKGYGELVENNADDLAEGMLTFIEKGFSHKTFDYNAYNKNAMSDFYREVCEENF